jgi:hypothetical protein
MECPRCESRACYQLSKNSASRKSPVLRLVLNPYRCADCGTRFWRIKGNLLTVVLLVFAIVAVVAFAAMTINTNPPAEEQFKFADDTKK